eukprot:4460059-Prymnesium_polylepis.1
MNPAGKRELKGATTAWLAGVSARAHAYKAAGATQECESGAAVHLARQVGLRTRGDSPKQPTTPAGARVIDDGGWRREAAVERRGDERLGGSTEGAHEQ